MQRFISTGRKSQKMPFSSEVGTNNCEFLLINNFFRPQLSTLHLICFIKNKKWLSVELKNKQYQETANKIQNHAIFKKKMEIAVKLH